MQELFSKLRFSYLEQVTKEKFLRAIVGDSPLIVEHQENIELESQLAEVKAVLKEQKDHVAQMVKDLEERGRELTGRKRNSNKRAPKPRESFDADGSTQATKRFNCRLPSSNPFHHRSPPSTKP